MAYNTQIGFSLGCKLELHTSDDSPIQERYTMSTASAPSRFWGVVALALNSLVQPAGQICGGTDSPALRLSPLFQVANAFALVYYSVRLSFGRGLPLREAMGAVAEEARLYHGTKAPERRFYFRAILFIISALPAFVKAMAIRGDPVSTGFALSFFVPFLVLECIQLLSKQPTRDSRTKMPSETMLWVTRNFEIGFGAIVRLTAFTFHLGYCLETMKSALMRSMLAANTFQQNRSIAGLSSAVAGTSTMMLMVYESAPKQDRTVLLVLALSSAGCFVGSMAFVNTITLSLGRRQPEFSITTLAFIIASTGTLAHLSIYLCLTSTILHTLSSGEVRHKKRFFEQWIALWTVICIFLHYGYFYDASGTYKPAWTELLP